MFDLLCRDRQLSESFYAELGVDVGETGSSDISVFFNDLTTYGETDANTAIVLQCDDLLGVVDYVKKSGIKIVSPCTMSPWGFTMVILDPDGRLVVLTEDNRKLIDGLSNK
jgi:predicted enzyme related to lactoylglutathione lyase